RGKISHAACAANGAAGVFRSQPKRLRLRGNVKCVLWVGDARTRAGRFGVAELRIGAIGAGDVSDSRVRVRRTEAKMVIGAAARQSNRMLWAHGTAIRLQSRGNVEPCREKGR